jgi:toxin YoeB
MAKKEIIWSELAKLEFYNVLEFYVVRNENSHYSLKILEKLKIC